MLLAPPPLIYESSYRSASTPLFSNALIPQITTDKPPPISARHTSTAVHSLTPTPAGYRQLLNYSQTRNSSAQISNSAILECTSALQLCDTVDDVLLKLSEYVVYLASATSTTIATRPAGANGWQEICTSHRAVSVSAPWLNLTTITDVDETATRQTSNRSNRSRLDNEIASTIMSRNTSAHNTVPDTNTLNQENLDAHNAQMLMPISLFNKCIHERSPVILLGNAMYDDKTHNNMAADPYFIYCFTERVTKQAPRSVACFTVQVTESVQTVLYVENCYSTTAFTHDRVNSIQLLINAAAQHLQLLNMKHRMAQMEAQMTEHRDAAVAIAEAHGQRDAAVQAAQHKTAFLSNMSHELRTPLNSVLGVVRLLASTELSNEQAQYVEMLNSSGQLLLSIISDILDFNKIDSNRLELEQREFSLLECVETSANMLHDMAVQKQLDLAYRFGPTVPRFVVGDSVRLQQILLNLCSNSIKFGREGHVLLNVDTVDDYQSDNPMNMCLRFSVADDGIGIAQELQSKLFTSFTQAEHSTNRRFGGTGLGLAISKRLAIAMGGDMTVQSEEHVGSTFTFTVILQRSARREQLGVDEQTVKTATEAGTQVQQGTQRPGLRTSASSTSLWSENMHVRLADTVHALKDSTAMLLDGKRILMISDAYASNMQLRALLEPHHVTLTTVPDIYAAITLLQLDTVPSKRNSGDDEYDFRAGRDSSTSSTVKFDLIIHNSYRANTSPQQLLGSLMRRLTVSQLPYIILFIHAGRNALKRAGQTDSSDNTNPTNSPQFWTRQLDQLQLVEVTKPIKQRQLLKTIAYLFDRTPASAPTSPQLETGSVAHANMMNEVQAILASTNVTVPDTNTQAAVYLPASPETAYQSISSPKRTIASTSSSAAMPTGQSPRTTKRTLKSSVAARTGVSSREKSDVSMQIRRMSSEMPLRILLAEDNIVGQKMLLMMLNKLGYSDVVTALNGDDVLELLNVKYDCRYFDCILMDVNMNPGMDGLTCTRHIREHATKCELKCTPYIVAQTANVSTEFRDACGAAGMNAWLSKPIQLEQLIQCLKLAYEHKRTQDGAITPKRQS